MALQAIAAFFVPLSAEEERQMRIATRRARSVTGTPTAADFVATTANEEEAAGSTEPHFSPLRTAAPLAFVSAHPWCRVAAEASTEGVQVAYTHYRRPDEPPALFSPYVWDVSPPPPPELCVRVNRLPLKTSGFAEGVWWLHYISHCDRGASPFRSPNAAVSLFPPFAAVRDIRVVLEKQDIPAVRHRARSEPNDGGAVATSSDADVTGSKGRPITDADLILSYEDTAVCRYLRHVPVTSLELQQLAFLPCAMRLLPCLFGRQLSAALFTRCTCAYDASLREQGSSRYTLLSKRLDGEEVWGVALHRSPLLPAVPVPYGATNLTYLSMCACGGETFWTCITLFFLYPQVLGSDAALPLAPLRVLDVGDNKSLSSKQMRQVLLAVKARNTYVPVVDHHNGCDAPSPSQEQPQQSGCESLRELNTCFTRAIQGVRWREEFAGLGCHLRRLAMARCDIDGDAVIDILCAGEMVRVPPPPPVSVTEEPFSNALRRVQLLDMRWNLKVTSSTIEKLRDEHAVHCKHLRLAGTAIGWEAAHGFATTVTP